MLNDCVAASPSALAAVKASSVTPAGRLPTTLTAVTRLSLSVALTKKLPAAPAVAATSGQLGRMGALLPPPPPPPQTLKGLDELRGPGVPRAKSPALLLVSVQPLAARSRAVVLVAATEAVPSKKLAVP